MIKTPKMDPQMVLYIAAGLALLYVTYKSTKAVGNAIDSVTSMPGRVAEAVADTASNAAEKASVVPKTIWAGLSWLPNQISDAWDGLENVATDAWGSVTDLFEGSSVAAGTTTTPRTVSPEGLTFSEGVADSLDLFDLRYYGVQGNTVLPAKTNQSGPGGGGLAVGTSTNSGAFFNTSNPYAGM